MEAKKNPGKDIHKISGIFFQIGLIISIAIVITAFEWTTKFKKPEPRAYEEIGNEIFIIPATDHIETPLPAPIKKEVIPSVIKNYTPVTETSSSVDPKDADPPIDIEGSLKIPSLTIEKDAEEKVEEIVSFSQKAPEPVGGYEAFYKMMGENMKYPSSARKFNVSGKVLVEFIVNQDGSVVDQKVIRGIGYGCDEEAMRVIGLSKWNPGKQRGNQVRVKMVLTVVFQLH